METILRPWFYNETGLFAKNSVNFPRTSSTRSPFSADVGKHLVMGIISHHQCLCLCLRAKQELLPLGWLGEADRSIENMENIEKKTGKGDA